MVKGLFKSRVKKTEDDDKTKKKSIAVSGLDLKKELIDELLERGKQNKVLSYEEVIEFSDKNNLNDSETNNLLKLLEKENIDLAMQEDIDDDSGGKSYESEEGTSFSKLQDIKAKLSNIDSEDFMPEE